MIVRLEASELAASPLAFDRACRVARTPGDKIIIGQGGQAATQGAWAFDQFAWQHLARGVALEFEAGAALHLHPSAIRKTNGVERPQRDLNLLWCAGQNRITGGVFDAHGADHPGWCCGGVRHFGRFRQTGSTIIGLSGYRDLAEVFAISSEGATGGSYVEGVVVRDCLTQDAKTYVAGIYVGATVDNGITSQVLTCDVQLGQHGQFAFSSSFWTTFETCRGTAMRGWYTDWETGCARLIDCQFKASYSVIGSVALKPGMVRDIRVKGGTMEAPEGRLVEWWDQGGTHVGGVSFRWVKAKAKWRAAVAAATGRISFTDSELECGPDSITPGSITPMEVPSLP